MKTIVKAIILTATLALSHSMVSACVSYHWTGESNSNWNDSDNWREDFFGSHGVPDNNDYAIIDKSEYNTAPDPILSDETYSPVEVSVRNGANVTFNYDLSTSTVSVYGAGNQVQINSDAQLQTANLTLLGNNTDLELNGGGTLTASDDLIFGVVNASLTNNLTGMLEISDDLIFQLTAGRVENNGNISILDDLRTNGVAAVNNRIINNLGAVLNIEGDISLQGAASFIDNEGTINQTGNFVGISLLSQFKNKSTGIWKWTSTATPDSNLTTALAANGVVNYAGLGAQKILPIVHNKIIISGSGTKQLQGTTSVSSNLTISSGRVALNNADLIIGSSATISNASSSRYIITNGTGKLIQNGIGAGGRTGNVLFPIGTSASSYTPLIINNSGTADNYSVRLGSAVYDGGYSGTAQTSDVVNKTWYIDEEVIGGSDVALTFQWNDADQLSGLSPTDVKVIHYDGTQWETMASGAAIGSGTYTMTATNISSFSPFGIEGGAGTLPVELLYFKGDMTGDVAVLEWATASELNNDYFTLERTTDLENFDVVTTIKGKGTTEERNDYKYHDNIPLSGTVYYRLKQTDFDGTFTYSDVIKIINNSVSETAELNMYPVPNHGDQLTLTIKGLASEKETPVVVYNTQGQIVHQQQVVIENASEVVLAFQEKLPVGVYTLRVNTAQPLTKQFSVR